jgi:RNA polymerase sigma factor (sigma-70 family)
MSSVSHSEIWNRFVKGEQTCFRELFESYYKGLYGYGLKISKNPELVEDCIQNLFVSIWERREDLGHVTSPNVYLYVSLRRSILQRVKKRNHLEGYNDDRESPIEIEFGIEEIIIKNESKKEHRENLRRAINQLSNQQKEVLYLHYYNGMSYGEIEEILSINRQSVRNHMYRAMETLRAVLDIDIMRLVISLLIAFLIM